MNIRLIAALAMVASTTPAAAAERVVTVTSFDRVRVDGPYRVEIVTGRGASARIIGARDAIDAVLVSVQGKALVIRSERTRLKSGFDDRGATGPVVIRLTTGLLRGATLSGSGAIAIDRASGVRLDLAVEGSGNMSVGRVDAERVEIVLLGSGRMTLAGNARAANAVIRGAATLEAGALTVNDLRINTESAGTVSAAARTTARVTSTGSGETLIAGKPACTVSAFGAGTVVCGS